MKLKITIIGGGNMGAAIIGGIRDKYSVVVCDKDKKRSQYLKRTFWVAVEGIHSAVKNSDVIILAVKPQGMAGVLEELRPLISPKQLVVSVAAGITTKYLQKGLGNGVKIVRTMPNLPSQIQEGVTAIARGDKATSADVKIVREIFDCVGKTVVVEEKLINAVTAVSGSGPAYIFYFVETFLSAAASVGLKGKLGQELVLQTVKGSIDLLIQSKDDAKQLRKKVASKGGTTQAALSVLEKKGVAKALKLAVLAAKKKAKELST